MYALSIHTVAFCNSTFPSHVPNARCLHGVRPGLIGHHVTPRPQPAAHRVCRVVSGCGCNRMIAVDRFIFSNSNTPNQPFSVRALMRTASSWNSLRIQFRDVSGNASIACSEFGALGLSYSKTGVTARVADVAQRFLAGRLRTATPLSVPPVFPLNFRSLQKALRVWCFIKVKVK
jgi:hypothetical protein